jgi:hypothetical protein
MDGITGCGGSGMKTIRWAEWCRNLTFSEATILPVYFFTALFSIIIWYSKYVCERIWEVGFQVVDKAHKLYYASRCVPQCILKIKVSESIYRREEDWLTASDGPDGLRGHKGNSDLGQGWGWFGQVFADAGHLQSRIKWSKPLWNSHFAVLG